MSPTITTETSLKKSTTSEETTTTKAGARRDKREESEEKGKKSLGLPINILDFCHKMRFIYTLVSCKFIDIRLFLLIPIVSCSH